MPRFKGQRELITYDIYDTVRLGANPAAGTQATFFGTQRGQGTSAVTASGVKTNIDTNMQAAGQLPAPWTFTIFQMGIQLDPSVTLAEAQSILTNLSGQLLIGAKEYWTGPCLFLSGAAGIAGNITNAGTSAGVTNGVADPRAAYSLSQPIQLDVQENFAFVVTAAAAITAAVQSSVIRMFLRGELDRSVQ